MDIEPPEHESSEEESEQAALEKVAQGIAVVGYNCPECDEESHYHSAVWLNGERVRIYDCCFYICHDEVCKIADRCEDCEECNDCCACNVCQCRYEHKTTDEICSNCMQCDDHCCCMQCDRCCEMYDNTTTVNNGSEYCDDCLERVCTWCEECEEYFEADDEHNHGCDCEVPHINFNFPNNGKGTVANDERLTVELPAGIIDDEGIRRIWELLYLHRGEASSWQITEALDNVGTEWIAKRGNFTRRISAALYKQQVKLPDGILSEVGNLARQHSSETSLWYIEFTRDLNQDADYFFNSDSCWWQSYSASRCCLKNWGGLGMRSFENDYRSSPNGRVWVQPLDEDWDPTHDTINAHAYIVYNGYGALSGYPGARIIAYLTSKTYKKINMKAENIYVNGESAYLIADQETMNNTSDSLSYNYDEHKRF